MSIDQVNEFFQLLTKTTAVLKEDLHLTYLDALLETTENLLDGKIPEEQKNLLSEESISTLQDEYKKIDLSGLTAEEKKKGFHLAVLKGMKEEYVQPNHQMTPDSIGQLMSYFIQLFFEKEQSLRVIDFASGTGNLLSVVISTLEKLEKEVQAEGIEVDELLISLASVNFALQKKVVRLTHQDALTNLLVEPSDVVIADLPIGYYPQDDVAAKFHASFKEGHSYAHYLFIEQGMNYLKENGIGLFLIPGRIFEEEKAATLVKAIQEEGYIQAVIQMPEEWFQNKASQKSLLLVQKKGERAKQAKEVLFANAPDFRNQHSVAKFLAEIKNWKESIV